MRLPAFPRPAPPASPRRWCALAAAVAVGLLVGTQPAQAAEIPFGPYDIPTVFFIDKTDDHNRVDYGLRLDEHCAPVSDTPLFPYWREFEKAPPVRTHKLGTFEYVAYGFKEQRLVRRSEQATVFKIELKKIHRPIILTIQKGADGHCTAVARTEISGQPDMVFISAHVVLKGWLKVAYVDVFGRHSATGEPLTERIAN